VRLPGRSTPLAPSSTENSASPGAEAEAGEPRAQRRRSSDAGPVTRPASVEPTVGIFAAEDVAASFMVHDRFSKRTSTRGSFAGGRDMAL
jgi:hypothetical protein